MNTVRLNRVIQIIEQFDVVVIGAGASGICAAISSSRAGASTVLIERYGIVGGGLTSAHVGPIMGGTSAGTIAEEVWQRLGIKPRHVHDFERAKIELPMWLEEENVTLYLQSTAADVLMEGNKIKGVVIATPSGLKGILGKVVIDATGDGIICAMANVPYNMGRDDGLVQPISIMFTLGGVAKDAIYCQGVNPQVSVPRGDFVELCKKACKEGRLPQRVDTVRIFHSARDTERMVNATQINYINPLSAQELSSAEASVRGQVKMVHEFLKEIAPGYENSFIQGSASTVGVRESRRITGEYELNDNDVETGAKFKDVVVHNANFLIDIHNPDGGGQAEGISKSVLSYDIPFRCLVPLEVENLLITGRAISGTHRALASYRVMNICMPIGQATGLAAALCIKNNVFPRNLDYRILQDELIKLGVDLFSEKQYTYPFNPKN